MSWSWRTKRVFLSEVGRGPAAKAPIEPWRYGGGPKSQLSGGACHLDARAKLQWRDPNLYNAPDSAIRGAESAPWVRPSNRSRRTFRLPSRVGEAGSCDLQVHSPVVQVHRLLEVLAKSNSSQLVVAALLPWSCSDERRSFGTSVGARRLWREAPRQLRPLVDWMRRSDRGSRVAPPSVPSRARRAKTKAVASAVPFWVVCELSHG